MALKVNLDALIPRLDFEAEDSPNVEMGTKIDSFAISDLKKKAFFFLPLRKPDFQRETSEWDARKISDFIVSFIQGDLIPAIILWKSPTGLTFIVDGSHRISALAAWINDDYGDGEITRKFYDGMVPRDQIDIALKTRSLIEKTVGRFDSYQLATENPEQANPELLSRARKLATLSIHLQWIPGNASKAEQSFFKINQQATPIDKTEAKILKARRKPNGIVARAIMRGGKGHKYWGAFSKENQEKIESLASEVHDILFVPDFESPIKSLDLPIAGKAYSGQTLPLVLDFIHIVNGVGEEEIAIDEDGAISVEYLKKCKQVAQRINSSHPSSLGLHPIVYFYSANGRHKPASFYAIVSLMMELEKRNKFRDFIKVREGFESIILKYDYIVQQIVRRYRGAPKSYSHVRDYYLLLIEKLLTKKKEDVVVQEILDDPDFVYVGKIPLEELIVYGKDFTNETKSEVYIRDALTSALKCKICNGLIHRNSISVDHVKRKQDGGMGVPENAQLTHPYCNTTVKN